jgi:hypothetical protein
MQALSFAIVCCLSFFTLSCCLVSLLSHTQKGQVLFKLKC